MKILSLLTLLFSLNASAAYDSPADAAFKLNNSPLGSQVRLGDLMMYKKVQIMRAQYKFASLGGAVSTVTLLDLDGKAAVLPSGAIVVNCLIDVVTAPTSGGAATVALGTGQAGNDLKAATAIASYTGLVACVPVGSAATSIKLTANRSPTATIAVAALTAGEINVLIHYLVP